MGFCVRIDPYARGTSRFVLVARLRRELRASCSLQAARGTSRSALATSGTGKFAFRARMRILRQARRFEVSSEAYTYIAFSKLALKTAVLEVLTSLFCKLQVRPTLPER